MSNKNRLRGLVSAVLISAVLGLGAWGGGGSIAYAVDPTPTPLPPTSNITVIKTAVSSSVDPGGLVGYNITVVNSGFAGASGVGVTDLLPNGVLWTLGMVGAGGECNLSNTFGTQVLSCNTSLAPRHLNDSQTDFINPSFTVTIWGLAGSCGATYLNSVIVVNGAKVSTAGPVQVTVSSCPTPVPTATPIPATPTPLPPTPTPTLTSTPILTSTPTPIPTPTIVPEPFRPTPTIGRAPGAPNTGNTSTKNTDSSQPLNPLLTVTITIFGALLGTAIAVMIILHYRRHNELS